MAFIINDRVVADKLAKQLDKARKDNIASLDRLSSGKIFTSSDPRPSERALAEGLEFRLRSLTAAKRNINDAVSLLQTAESGFSEINNIMTRMKEINVAGASTTITDKERRFLMIEYQALYDEINRIAETTSFNGISLLNGANESVPESLIFRIDDPFQGGGDDSNGSDINTIVFDGIKNIVATTAGLGLKSARSLLEGSGDEEGISVSDLDDLLAPEESGGATVYDEALDKLSMARAIYGAMQARLDRAIDFNDVYQENIAAAKSKIADTDYAQEVANMAQNNILMQATTGLLAQSNMNASLTLNLVGSLLK